jgi:hypothetical protein
MERRSQSQLKILDAHAGTPPGVDHVDRVRIDNNLIHISDYVRTQTSEGLSVRRRREVQIPVEALLESGSSLFDYLDQEDLYADIQSEDIAQYYREVINLAQKKDLLEKQKNLYIKLSEMRLRERPPYAEIERLTILLEEVIDKFLPEQEENLGRYADVSGGFIEYYHWKDLQKKLRVEKARLRELHEYAPNGIKKIAEQQRRIIELEQSVREYQP